MREAVIVAASRTAVGKSSKGSTRNQRSDEMAATVIQELLRQTEGKLRPEEIDDVFLGCAMPEGSQGLNTARVIALRAGLPVDVPAQTVNRFCSSGLQTIASAAERIIAGGAETVVAGGVETMSLVPMTGFRISPNPYMAAEQPEVYMNMGLTAERVADEFEVSRQAQDEFALRSHQRAVAATEAGKFKEEIVPVVFEEVSAGENGSQKRREITFEVDEHLRADTTLEGLAKLRPVFKESGTVTAGNASPLSDGAAGVIVMERDTAEKKGLTPLLRFLGFGVAGVPPEIMGIGPVKAVPKALARTGLVLDEIDLIELNEAFAAQALAVIRELEIPPEKVNVNGGAISLGHPLGCTGAKLTVQLLHELRRREGRYGMVTMCVGGGQGAAGVFERLN
ncbi:MAG: thiolase family protein [Anaerolineales bacterium]|jgi:acetyl-CoA acyltransferase|nr:thiolase family protein [Anaerolineales bacterium]MDP7643756.1 thiolase family protein [Anaerolineales bacterium]HJN41494.1 thiolase family protein [Anaerolineales bacterium]|tara:strand:- start:3564 stop:4748 length:1185 start_codon:yes stop_codon:yes gene_type:complete